MVEASDLVLMLEVLSPDLELARIMCDYLSGGDSTLLHTYLNLFIVAQRT